MHKKPVFQKSSTRSKLPFLMLPLLCLLLSVVLFAEEGATNLQAKSLTVLPSTDTTNFQLGQPLQTALGRLAQESGYFNPVLGTTPLPGFTRNDIGRGLESNGTETLTFAYLEQARLSIFLFDASRAKEFVVASETLEGELSNDYLEGKFRTCWNSLLEAYLGNQFQPLPGEDSTNVSENSVAAARALQARQLFRELSFLEEKNYFAGAHIGMARFAALGATNSTVNFGGLLGMNVAPRISLSMGADVFSYWLLNLSGAYQIPFAEKYVSLHASLGISRVMGVVTENLGFASTNIPVGSTLFGPGFSFDIPLVGAILRGDLRYYVGSSSIFVGTYGIIYAL